MMKILKNPLSIFIKMAKPKPNAVKNTKFHNPLSANGSSSTPLLKRMMVKFLLAKQVKELQTRNAQLEEENLVKKAIVISWYISKSL